MDGSKMNITLPYYTSIKIEWLGAGFFLLKILYLCEVIC